MPAPVEPGHANMLLMMLGTAISTVGPLLIAGAVGFAKLSTKVDLYRTENTKDHKVIFRKLDDLNGTGRDNEKNIEAMKRVCKDRHP